MQEQAAQQWDDPGHVLDMHTSGWNRQLLVLSISSLAVIGLTMSSIISFHEADSRVRSTQASMWHNWAQPTQACSQDNSVATCNHTRHSLPHLASVKSRRVSLVKLLQSQLFDEASSPLIGRPYLINMSSKYCLWNVIKSQEHWSFCCMHSGLRVYRRWRLLDQRQPQKSHKLNGTDCKSWQWISKELMQEASRLKLKERIWARKKDHRS